MSDKLQDITEPLRQIIHKFEFYFKKQNNIFVVLLGKLGIPKLVLEIT